ncbi:MAG TPA: hypothetical protein DIW43_03690 [Spongiibacteraceae bacterium]|nr:hypothetical protein [Spongiibacteraceae bacterium]HCS26528.1 hypothetical protein [Spongiibacteraceae bacterium]
MTQVQTTSPQVPNAVRLALIAGMYLFMSAWFIAYSRSAHHTIVYAGFIGPALIHLGLCLWRSDATTRTLRSPIYITLTLFLVYMVLSTTWSDNADSLAHYIKRLVQTLVFIYGVYIIVRFEPRHFWRSIIVALALCGPWLAVNLIFFPEAAFTSNRFKGANAGVHYLLTGAMLGSFVVLGSSYLIQKLERRRPDTKTFLLFAAIGVVFYALLLTESRSALLALVATAGFAIFSSQQVRRFRTVLLLAIIVIAIMLAPYADVFISRGFSNRFEIWEAALRWIAQRPWLGHGFDALFVLPISSGEELYDAHNIHLEVLYEGGVLGGLLWLGFLGALTWRGWTCRHSALGQAVLALLVYSISVKFFESRGILSRPTEFWYLLWLCAGMALACRRDDKPASTHSCAPSPEPGSAK